MSKKENASKHEKKSKKKDTALQNDVANVIEENENTSDMMNAEGTEQEPEKKEEPAKAKFFEEERASLFIDKEEAEAFLEAQRKKKLRSRIITTVVSVVLVLLAVFILFNVLFGGNSGIIQFSDYALVMNPAKPVGEKVDVTSGDTLFASVKNPAGGVNELWYSPADTLLKVVVKNASGKVLDTFRSWPEPTQSEMDPATADSEFPRYKANHDIVSSLINVGFTTSNLDPGKFFGVNQRKHTEEIHTIENGFRIKYALDELNTPPKDIELASSTASFVVEFYLDTNGDLIVNVPKSELVEMKAKKESEADKVPRVAYITALPFLGAARQGDEGYFVHADGSGALTYFDTPRISTSDEYSKRVFGYDNTFDEFNNPVTNNEAVMMGVFGIVKGNSMVTCFVEESEASALVTMGQPGLKSFNFYYINFCFHWREFYTSSIGNNQEAYTFTEVPSGIGDFRQRYVFSASEPEEPDFTYVDVAAQARDFLLDKWKADIGTMPYLTEDLINTVNGDNEVSELLHLKLFLQDTDNYYGSLFKSMKVMTSFSDVQGIITDMRGANASRVRYTMLGWQNDGYYGNVTKKYSIEKAVGGKSGLIDLNRWSKEQGVDLAIDQNLLILYGNLKAGISQRDALAKNAATEYLEYQMTNNAGVFYRNSGASYISPLYYYRKMLDKDIDKLTDLNVQGVALQQVGDLLFTDYNKKNALLRQQELEYYREWIARYKEAFGDVSVYYGFEYAASVADRIYDMPNMTSQLFNLDEAIPFMQIVYHGVVDYYCAPINRSSHDAMTTLKAIEYGSYLTYEVTKNTTEELKYTEYNSLFKAQYSYLRGNILNGYTIADKVLSKVENALITNHYCVDAERAGNVYCTEYSNGVKVYVNYGSSDYTAEEGLIPSMGVGVVSSGTLDTVKVAD